MNELSFNIYHPVDGMNHLCTKNELQYKYVATVKCVEKEQVFALSQNEFNSEYRRLHIRSTSVGDIFVTPEGVHYMIKGVGLEEVHKKCTAFFNDQESEIRVANMLLQHPEDFGISNVNILGKSLTELLV